MSKFKKRLTAYESTSSEDSDVDVKIDRQQSTRVTGKPSRFGIVDNERQLSRLSSDDS